MKESDEQKPKLNLLLDQKKLKVVLPLKKL